MENDKIAFKATGFYFEGATTYEVQLSFRGDHARYRATTKYTCKKPEISQGKWQEIKFNKDGWAYITVKGKKLYLHKFQRVY